MPNIVDRLLATQAMAEQLRACITTDAHVGEHGLDGTPDSAKVTATAISRPSGNDCELAGKFAMPIADGRGNTVPV